MERFDFASVMAVIRKNICEEQCPNQMDFICTLFQDADIDGIPAGGFDNGQVCKWLNGLAKLSPDIIRYYLKKDNARKLQNKIQESILPIMPDSAMAIQELSDLIIQAPNISDDKKIYLTKEFKCKNKQEEALLITEIVCLAMQLPFVKRDVRKKQLVAPGCLSPVLDVVMKYRCRILFTSRIRYDNRTAMEIVELKSDTLCELIIRFFPKGEKRKELLHNIITLLHRHTFTVELSARLLSKGILSPKGLLAKLEKEKAAMDASDIIGTAKDGHSKQATYYDHIHSLFALYKLSKSKKETLRNLTMIPEKGISCRCFSHWNPG